MNDMILKPESSALAVAHQNPEAPASGMLGLSSLFELMADLGVPAAELLAGTGLDPRDLEAGRLSISPSQKITIFRNVMALSPDPGVPLRAGQQLRFSDFGVYGYVLLSCANLGEAIDYGHRYVSLAGPALAKGYRIEGDEMILSAHDVLSLGPLLAPISEFWFAAIQTLISKVTESAFHPKRVDMPYPPPAHAALYEEVFGCPVHFNAPAMEMRLDTSLLSVPLPNANPVTAELCASFCQRMLQDLDDEPRAGILRAIRQQFLKTPGEYPSLRGMAERLNMTERTLQRHLAAAGTSYHQVIDDMRQRLSIEYLENTSLSVEDILRAGFSDASNFRKAFKKWTGKLPSSYRTSETAA